MALEDRCSPQSAPSPPGLQQIPQQYQQQQYQQQQLYTKTTVLDMSIQQHTVTANPTNGITMLPHNAAAAASLYQQQQLQHLHHLQQLQQLHQQQLANAGVFHHPGFDAAAALQQRLSGSPGAHSTASTPASTVTIKEEENDSIMDDSFHNQTGTTAGTATEDEDDDIDVDDVDESITTTGSQRLPRPAHQQSSAGKQSLAFSISNILSDRFGGSDAKTQTQQQHQEEQQQQYQQQQQTNLEAHANNIFRPFDANRAAAATPSAFTRVDLLEFSRQQQAAAAAAAATAAMMIERANFLNCFNPAAYPRIHEEIVNSRMRRNGAMVLAPGSTSAAATNQCPTGIEKSALGSLCKAVSQIGQTVPAPASSTTSSCSGSTNLNCIASPPPASNASTISSSSISTAASSSSSSSSSGGSSLNSSPSTRLPNSNGNNNNDSSPQPIPPPSAISRDSGMESSDDTRSETGSTTTDGGKNELWPAWVYCTRYSDRPSSGLFEKKKK